MAKRFLKVIFGSALLMILTACGSNDIKSDAVNEISNETISVVEESTDFNEITSKEQETSKPYITDFYNFANYESFSKHEFTNKEYVYFATDKYVGEVYKKLYADLENKSASTFANDNSMYKMMSFYEQMIQQVGSENSISKIKEVTDNIEGAKNISDLYAFMLDEDYSFFNYMMKIDYQFMDNDDYCPQFYPKSLFSISYISDESEKIIADAYQKMFQELGYEEDIAKRMGYNASNVNATIINFYNQMEDGGYVFYDEENWQDVKTPFLDVLKTLNYGFHDRFGKVHYYSYNSSTYISFLDELLNEIDLQEIKDYYAACALTELCPFGTTKMIMHKDNIKQQILGVEQYEESDSVEHDKYCFNLLLSYDNGTLANYYKEHFIREEKIELARTVFDEVKQELVALVNEADWANPKIKEQLGFKLKNMKFLIGAYDEWNMLQDMEIYENVIDTYLSLLKSERSFNHRYQVEEPTIVSTDNVMTSWNLAYHRYSNTFIIHPSIFELDVFTNDYDYEELVGFLANPIAHEMSHSLDYNSIYLRSDGKNGSFMDDAAYEAYDNMYQQIYDFLDGKQTYYGNTINGYGKCHEFFCDLFSMKICLKLLENTDNVDYDTFFRSYAQGISVDYIPSYEKLLLEEESHIPDKDRWNYLFANFDEYYNTYEVDESSIYYVPQDKRIEVYK